MNNIYSKKLNFYLLECKKRKRMLSRFEDNSNMSNYFLKNNYFFYDIFENDEIVRNFLLFFMKKGKKNKYLNIIYNIFFYIKNYIRQQPIIFLKKTFKIDYNLYFRIKKLQLRKRLIYIPKVVDFKKQFNYSFKLINKWLLKSLKNFSKLNFNFYNLCKDVRFFGIDKKLSFLFIFFSFFKISKKLIKAYAFKFNKIALRLRFKLFNIKKFKYRKRRKFKKKEIKIQKRIDFYRVLGDLKFRWKNNKLLRPFKKLKNFKIKKWFLNRSIRQRQSKWGL